MRLFKRLFLIVAIILLITVVGFVVWASNPLGPMPEALEAMQSDSQVQVTEDGWITFQPAGAQPDTGLVIYPGGRVDPRSYAPIAREIAGQGYLAVIVPMPLNLAVFGSERAQEVIAAHPEIQSWAIGGHSLGGAMAARFAYKHPAAVRGLDLWAAYPASSDDLSGQDLLTLSLIGSLDGLGTGQGVQETRHLLPLDTIFITIEGGNHSQFGWYGDQPGDAEATISREEQQAQVLQATLQLLAGLQ